MLDAHVAVELSVLAMNVLKTSPVKKEFHLYVLKLSMLRVLQFFSYILQLLSGILVLFFMLFHVNYFVPYMSRHQ